MNNPPAIVLGDTEFFTPQVYIISDGKLSAQPGSFTRASTGTYFDVFGVLQTALTNGQRTHYMQDGSGDYGFFVEPAATNDCLQSEDFTTTWTTVNSTTFTQSAVAPDNNATGNVIIVDTTVSAPHAIEQTFTGSTSVDRCASVFVKQGTHTDMYLRLSDTADTDYIDIIVDLSDGSILQAATATGGNAAVTGGGVETLINGWYRVWISGICDSTTTAHKIVVGVSQGTTISYTGNGTDSIFNWGAQIETGSYPTSYIATTTIAETRAADVPLIDISSVSWFNGTEGTTYIDFKRLTEVDSAKTIAYQIDDGAASESISVQQSSTSKQISSDVTDGSVSQAAIVSSTGDANIRSRLAFAYKANDFATSLNGAAVGTDTSGTVPATSVNLRIGYSDTGEQLTGIIRDLWYYNTRLDNTTLVTLTT